MEHKMINSATGEYYVFTTMPREKMGRYASRTKNSYYRGRGANSRRKARR